MCGRRKEEGGHGEAATRLAYEEWASRVRMQKEREKDDKVLLPAHVLPLKYHITLQPDMDRFVFNGTESIEVTIARSG